MQEYAQLFENAGSGPGEKTLEDKFFEYEVSALVLITLHCTTVFAVHCGLSDTAFL